MNRTTLYLSLSILLIAVLFLTTYWGDGERYDPFQCGTHNSLKARLDSCAGARPSDTSILGGCNERCTISLLEQEQSWCTCMNECLA